MNGDHIQIDQDHIERLHLYGLPRAQLGVVHLRRMESLIQREHRGQPPPISEEIQQAILPAPDTVN
jgi:hypothetical protein